MSHGRRREYQTFFCKILCRLVTPRHASAHANHHNISLDLLAAASRGTGASRRGQAARRSVRRVQMSLKAATSASRCVLGYRRSDVSSQRMAASGHEERFPPLRLSAGYGFRKETIAEMRCNGRDAPKAAALPRRLKPYHRAGDSRSAAPRLPAAADLGDTASSK